MHRKTRGTLEQLEPRLLMSADLAPLPPDLPLPTAGDEASISVLEAETGNISHAEAATDPTFEPARERCGLVAVDSSTPRLQELVDQILAGGDGQMTYEVVLLEPDTDGIRQLDELLAVDGGLDALHLVGQGDTGALLLGSSRLESGTLGDDASHIVSWRPAFNPDASLQVHVPEPDRLDPTLTCCSTAATWPPGRMGAH